MYSGSAAIYAAGREISPTLSSTGSRGCSIFCTFVAHSANSYSKHASLAFPLGRHGGYGTCWVTGRSTSAISGRSYPSRKPRLDAPTGLGWLRAAGGGIDVPLNDLEVPLPPIENEKAHSPHSSTDRNFAAQAKGITSKLILSALSKPTSRRNRIVQEVRSGAHVTDPVDLPLDGPSPKEESSSRQPGRNGCFDAAIGIRAGALAAIGLIERGVSPK